MWANFRHVPSFVSANFPHIGCMKMWFLTSSETHGLRTPCILQLVFFIMEAKKMRIWPSRETEGWRVPRFVWRNFPHFGSLKMRVLPIREINVSRYLENSVEIIFIFEALKCNLNQSWNTRFKGTKLSVNNFPNVTRFEWANFPHFGAWKFDFCRFVKTNVWGYLSKSDFADSWNPRF